MRNASLTTQGIYLTVNYKTSLIAKSFETKHLADDDFLTPFNFSSMPVPIAALPKRNAYELQKSSFSSATNDIFEQILSLKTPQSLASFSSITPATKPLDEQLFDATSNVKILTSQVANYLSKDFRNKLFHQLDAMHNVDDWDSDDKPVLQASYSLFLKTITFLKPERIPSLGLSHTGNVLTAWITGNNRLILEFLPDGHLKWIVSGTFDNVTENSSGVTSILRLPKVLAPYYPDIWFKK